MKQLALLFVFFFSTASIFGQSTNQDFPSPVLREEIAGTIAARDIGDARLTRHFYAFYAGVGDVSLNVETTNFNGDIDLFEATTLRPISKITIYASDSAAKTSRIVYFRQRTQVLMRIEGRTPNDEPASYRINFSGSFAAATDLPQPPEDLEPKTSGKLSEEAVARVNSAGAIVEVLQPKTQPEPAKIEPEKPESKPIKKTPAEETTATTKRTTPPRRAARNRPPRRAAAQPPKTEETTKTEPAATQSETPTPAAPAPARTTRRSTAARRAARNQPAKTGITAEPKIDPLSNIRLVVVLKDGYKIERPMSEILRASVDKGTLVVIAKDGKIERFALLDVVRFSIEQ